MDSKKIQITAAVIIGLAVVAGLGVAITSRKHNPGAAKTDGLARPRGLALDAKGNLYIADSKNNRVEIRDAAGKVLKRVGGKEGSANGLFREDCDVKTTKDGFVVADTFHTLDPKGGLPWGRVQIFDASGKFVSAFGTNGQGSYNTLFGPRGLAVDSEGSIWLADTGNHRVLKFNAKGEYQFPVGGPRGKDKGLFQEPFGLAVDGQDNLYVADRLNFRIQVFKKDGTFLRMWKVEGWEESQACEPYLAVDAARGFIYATDTTQNKVRRWKLDGKDAKAYTASADGAAFNAPTGIVVRPSDGAVIVANSGNAAIVTLVP